MIKTEAIGSLSRLCATVTALIVIGSTLAQVASAQETRGPSLRVGNISSAKTCKLYQESEGRSGVLASPFVIGAYSSWRTWLVKDCVDNFASIRTSLEAALAATGKFTIRETSGAYTVEGRISEVSGGNEPAPNAPNPGDGYAYATSAMFVNMDVTLRDSKGRIVYGGLLTKHLETGFDVKSGTFRAWGSRSGEGLYTQIQHQVALAVARLVSFRLVPLRVISGEGKKIQLNYGGALMPLGTIVQATSPDGTATMRYLVTSATSDFATAIVDGGGDPSRIIVGSSAIVIEGDDPAANARRFEKVDLP